MSKQSNSPPKTTIFLPIALLLVFAVAIAFSESLPLVYSYFPAMGHVHAQRPYFIDTLMSLLVLPLALMGVSRLSAVRTRILRAFGDIGALNLVINTADFAPGAGALYLGPDHRILTASKLLVELARSDSVSRLCGERIKDAFPTKLARLLTELSKKAQYTRKAAAVEIPDWTPYSALALGPVVIYATPAFANEKFTGTIIILRSSADVRSAEDSAILHQMNYQVLFDSLPMGVAIFRPSIAADGGADGYLLDLNPALKRTVEGIPLPEQEPCSVVWPSFVKQEKLREGVHQLMNGATNYRCEFFSPALGRNLEVFMAPLPGGRLLAMVSDHTDVRMHEKQVLTLNDQLQRALASRNDYVTRVLDDIENFNQATADVVEARLEEIGAAIPLISGPVAATITEATAALYHTLHQVLRYQNAANVSYAGATLVHPGEVVSRLLESIGNRYPDISFTVESLPGVVANRDVLTSIIERLLLCVVNLPVWMAPARIEVGSERDFLATTIYVAGWGLDFSQMFIEAPTERQLLDWTLTSDLDVATVRRMVANHGGELFLSPTVDGQGVQLSFSIGNPT